MARFQSVVAIHIPNGGTWKAGTFFVDTVGNKVLSTDVVWASVANSGSMTPGLIPQEASATTIYNASRFAGIQIARPDGVNSIAG
jgi:hypothetical protein